MAQHNHHHHHHHDQSKFDPGSLYKEKWVQDGIKQLQRFFVANFAWMGVEDRPGFRLLDYACGDGTVSAALAPLTSFAAFQGIDIHPAQVERYNESARNLLHGQERRMFAIQGDISNPSGDLDQADWANFDVAVISMALHHVADPVDVLGRLALRVKTNGTVIVADWLDGLPLPSASSTSKAKHHAPYHHEHNQNPSDMIEVSKGEKVWFGFTAEGIEACMVAAGLKNIDIKLDPEISKLPEQFGGDRQAFYAKGYVA